MAEPDATTSVKASSAATSHLTGTSSAGMPPVPPAASGSGASRVQRMTASSSGSPDATPSVNGSPGSGGMGAALVVVAAVVGGTGPVVPGAAVGSDGGVAAVVDAEPPPSRQAASTPPATQRAGADQEAPPADRVHAAILTRAGRPAVAPLATPATSAGDRFHRFDIDSVAWASATKSDGTRR